MANVGNCHRLAATTAFISDYTIVVCVSCRWIIMAIVWVMVSAMMFTAQMEFFARIADPLIGGTYMTLLNTVSNLGNTW